MRIWDVFPGYLNRGSLLGEHRELHGLMSIHINRKKGYSRHPETMRWRNFLSVLALRHELLVAEMRLRGYKHHSPLPISPKADGSPNYLDSPARQFSILHEKYIGKEKGRIPLPHSVEELWQQHHLSVLARGQNGYDELERERTRIGFESLADRLVILLRQAPPKEDFDRVVEMSRELPLSELSQTTFLGEMGYWFDRKENELQLVPSQHIRQQVPFSLAS